jgi:hypothetical protein
MNLKSCVRNLNHEVLDYSVESAVFETYAFTT